MYKTRSSVDISNNHVKKKELTAYFGKVFRKTRTKQNVHI